MTFLIAMTAGWSSSLAFGTPGFRAQATLHATDGKLDELVDAGFVVQSSGGWYVDGAAVASAALGLRTVNSSQVGYDRDFFAHWSDPDGNGCDARNDILRRDLTNIALRAGDGCVVERGTLTDPYTGGVIPFMRGVATSGAVHIDHIVPLAAAWTGGANTWDATQREAFANDPMNLQAVDGRANSAKGSRLAAEWMPPNAAFHCTYLAQMTNVLVTYDLAVTPIDQDAIINGGSIDGVAFAGAKGCIVPAVEGDELPATPPGETEALVSLQSSSPSEGVDPPQESEERSSDARTPDGTAITDLLWPWLAAGLGLSVIVLLVPGVLRRRSRS